VMRGQSFNRESEIKPVKAMLNTSDDSEEDQDDGDNSENDNDNSPRRSSAHKFSTSLRPGVMRGQSFDHEFAIKPMKPMLAADEDTSERDEEEETLPTTTLSLKDRIKMFDGKK
jgi:hypothetical protein